MNPKERRPPAWTPPMRFLGAVLAAMLLPLLSSCGPTRHLHPHTGRAVQRVFKRQASKAPPAQLSEVGGEEAAIIISNLREQSSASDKGEAPKTIMLPLQR